MQKDLILANRIINYLLQKEFGDGYICPATLPIEEQISLRIAEMMEVLKCKNAGCVLRP